MGRPPVPRGAPCPCHAGDQWHRPCRPRGSHYDPRVCQRDRGHESLRGASEVADDSARGWDECLGTPAPVYLLGGRVGA
ncbi:MAG TPA: hypothetical protein VMV49_18050, partial [Candidatus Deferrimicrobium sp.]|nr:hypothetical protein [Candidatus Deferrimicrobium sp.]